MQIERKPNEYYHELYSYSFKDDHTILSIYLTEDKNLNFMITNQELQTAEEELNEFLITKENYELYMLFKELIDDFEKMSPLIEKSREVLEQFEDDYITNNEFANNNRYYNRNLNFITFDYPEIYKDRCITWASDNSYGFMINLLKIREVPRGIRISIKTSVKTDIFLGRNVKIHNSYSRQNPFSFLFMSFYYKLQSIDPNYHQMNLFELI